MYLVAFFYMYFVHMYFALSSSTLDKKYVHRLSNERLHLQLSSTNTKIKVQIGLYIIHGGFLQEAYTDSKLETLPSLLALAQHKGQREI
jgi:hypothetical protein